LDYGPARGRFPLPSLRSAALLGNPVAGNPPLPPFFWQKEPKRTGPRRPRRQLRWSDDCSGRKEQFGEKIHPLSPDVEELNDAFRIRGDAGE
jgi:hypothetical protein